MSPGRTTRSDPDKAHRILTEATQFISGSSAEDTGLILYIADLYGVARQWNRGSSR